MLPLSVSTSMVTVSPILILQRWSWYHPLLREEGFLVLMSWYHLQQIRRRVERKIQSIVQGGDEDLTSIPTPSILENSQSVLIYYFLIKMGIRGKVVIPSLGMKILKLPGNGCLMILSHCRWVAMAMMNIAPWWWWTLVAVMDVYIPNGEPQQWWTISAMVS